MCSATQPELFIFLGSRVQGLFFDKVITEKFLFEKALEQKKRGHETGKKTKVLDHLKQHQVCVIIKHLWATGSRCEKLTLSLPVAAIDVRFSLTLFKWPFFGFPE